jgi:hypothetical protein
MAGLYAADGSFNVTVVSGAAMTGLYAPDGSWNVVEVDGTTLTGLYHPCGAYNVVESDGRTGIYHPCGALNVSESPYVASSIHVTVVTGSLGGGGPGPGGDPGMFFDDALNSYNISVLEDF